MKIRFSCDSGVAICGSSGHAQSNGTSFLRMKPDYIIELQDNGVEFGLTAYGYGLKQMMGIFLSRG